MNDLNEETESAGMVMGQAMLNYINNPNSSIFIAENERFIVTLVKKGKGNVAERVAAPNEPEPSSPLPMPVGREIARLEVLDGGLAGWLPNGIG